MNYKINFHFWRKSFSIQCLVLSLAVLPVAFWYMTRWLEMPLYPDEIALRLQKARYLTDGFTVYGLYPCQSNVHEIPLFFRPVAYLFSTFDSVFGWSLVRGIPLFGVLLVVITTLVVILKQKAFGASLTLVAGFVGVVGSGLILMRGEAPILYLGAASLVGYVMLRYFADHPISAVFYVVLASFLASVAFFIHPESLIFTPVLVLILVRTAFPQSSAVVKMVAVLSILWIVGSAWSATKDLKMNCPEFPTAEQAFEVQSLPSLARYKGIVAVEDYLINKLVRYADQFTFKAVYDENYLPGLDSRTYRLSILNAALRFAVLLNLLLVVGVLFRIILRGANFLKRKDLTLSCKITLALDGPSPYLFLAIVGYLGLLVYDAQTAFYRDFHIHFMLVMLNAIALSTLGSVAKLFVWPLGVFSVVLSISSTIVLQTSMSEKFATGWAGPSIPQRTNWSLIHLEVMKAEKDCDINRLDSEVVIDDLTYDAMKRHRHLIPVTYLGFARDPMRSDINWLQKVLQHTRANAIVARCANFENLGLSYSFKEGQVCCLKLRQD